MFRQERAADCRAEGGRPSSSHGLKDQWAKSESCLCASRSGTGFGDVQRLGRRVPELKAPDMEKSGSCSRPRGPNSQLGDETPGLSQGDRCRAAVKVTRVLRDEKTGFSQLRIEVRLVTYRREDFCPRPLHNEQLVPSAGVQRKSGR